MSNSTARVADPTGDELVFAALSNSYLYLKARSNYDGHENLRRPIAPPLQLQVQEALNYLTEKGDKQGWSSGYTVHTVGKDLTFPEATRVEVVNRSLYLYDWKSQLLAEFPSYSHYYKTGSNEG